MKRLANNSKKSQFTIEFVILISFMFIVFVGFFAIVSYKLNEATETEKQQKIENLANLVGDELKLAISVNEGYVKTFKVPAKIDGNDYGISIIGNRELVIEFPKLNPEYEYVLFLPANVMGNISTGLNEIRKKGGTVHINSTEN